jgi:tetratricopeptide (TPR) repeat protein
VLLEARKIRHEPEKYVNAVRDWAEKGTQSRFALTPDEVVMRSPARSQDVALAAAHFELGQHLYRAGNAEAAVPHFKEAHRLQPGNWTYKRQAWVFAHPLQGPSEQYDSDWLSDVREIGAENYYPALEM